MKHTRTMKIPTLTLVLAVITVFCAQAEGVAPKGAPVFTPARIEQDLVGKSVGPEAVVKTRTDSSGGSSGERSTSAYITVPLDMVFDEANITAVTVLHAEVQGDRAQVVARVETVSNYKGRLRLHYEFAGGDWILLQIENLDFRQQ